ncbi:MAG: (Fe-S)-binding protein [Thermodesulfobacteriota bacterium]
MARIAHLIREMQELGDLLAKCTRCGMCQAVCPLFSQTGHEGDVARGKLALLDGLAQHLLDNPEKTAERLNRCLLCGACERNCSSGVQVLEIFLKARAILAGYNGLPAAKKMMLRRLLTRPRTFDRVMAWAARHQHLFLKPAGGLLGASCGRIGPSYLTERHMAPLAAVPLHRRIDSLDTPAAAGGPRVAFFPGCLLDKVFPEAAMASLKVLRHFKAGIFMPKDQGCCGIPALAAGDEESFRRLVRHNMELFEGGAWEYLVTACATCTFTIKKIWPMMAAQFPAALRKRIVQLSERAIDISQLLVSIIGLPPEPPPDGNGIPITYHDPCHLNKSFGITVEPRRLIAANPVYRLVEMPLAGQCCGLGGSFSIDHYEISSAIGERKRQGVLASGCAVVATGCPACMLQLMDQLSKSGREIAVRHTVEIFAEGLPGGIQG